jgi:hypothetical protein
LIFTIARRGSRLRGSGGGLGLGRGLGAFGFFRQSDGLRLVAVVAELRDDLLFRAEDGVVERPLRGDVAITRGLPVSLRLARRCRRRT